MAAGCGSWGDAARLLHARPARPKNRCRYRRESLRLVHDCVANACEEGLVKATLSGFVVRLAAAEAGVRAIHFATEHILLADPRISDPWLAYPALYQSQRRRCVLAHLSDCG
jgi:hypothetical protein